MVNHVDDLIYKSTNFTIDYNSIINNPGPRNVYIQGQEFKFLFRTSQYDYFVDERQGKLADHYNTSQQFNLNLFVPYSEAEYNLVVPYLNRYNRYVIGLVRKEAFTINQELQALFGNDLNSDLFDIYDVNYLPDQHLKYPQNLVSNANMWLAGDPNDWQGAEDCFELYPIDYTHVINDMGCTQYGFKAVFTRSNNDQKLFLNPYEESMLDQLEKFSAVVANNNDWGQPVIVNMYRALVKSKLILGEYYHPIFGQADLYDDPSAKQSLEQTNAFIEEFKGDFEREAN